MRNQYLKTFGANVRRRRERLGLRQDQLCQRVTFTRTYLSRIETGKADVRIGTLLRLSKALNTKPGVLLKGTGNGGK